MVKRWRATLTAKRCKVPLNVWGIIISFTLVHVLTWPPKIWRNFYQTYYLFSTCCCLVIGFPCWSKLVIFLPSIPAYGEPPTKKHESLEFLGKSTGMFLHGIVKHCKGLGGQLHLEHAFNSCFHFFLNSFLCFSNSVCGKRKTESVSMFVAKHAGKYRSKLCKHKMLPTVKTS